MSTTRHHILSESEISVTPSLLEESGRSSVTSPPLPFSSPSSPSSSRSNKEEKRSFGIDFLLRFVKLIKIGFPVLSTEFYLLIALIVILCVWQVMVYLMGLLPSQFYGAILSNNKKDLIQLVIQAIVYTGLISIAISVRNYLSSNLALRWRRKLVDHLNAYYLKHHYYVSHLDNRVDNADQRITMDVYFLTNTCGNLFSDFLTTPFVILYYSWLSLSILGWIGPVGVYLFFLIFSLVIKYLMAPLVRLIFMEEKLEGDFRFGHSRLRSQGESIAIWKGDERELSFLGSAFDKIFSNSKRIYLRQLLLNVGVNLFVYGGSILAYILIAIPTFSGAFNTPEGDSSALAAMVSKSAFAILMLISGFSTLLQLSQQSADIAGYTFRVSEFVDILVNVAHNHNESHLVSPSSTTTSLFQQHSIESGIPLANLRSSDDESIQIENLSVYTPSGASLFSDLSFSLTPSNNVLIMGPSGCGKSSLVRVMSGLWKSFHGTINLPTKAINGRTPIMFVPQAPYLPFASLRDQVTYPEKSSLGTSEIDTSVITILNSLNLSHLLTRHGHEGLDHTDFWENSLSPGEKQRLIIGRILYHKPLFAILDETTSSLGEEMEAQIYNLLKREGVTMLTIGHRSSLKQFHQLLIAFDSNGSHQTHTLPPDAVHPS